MGNSKPADLSGLKRRLAVLFSVAAAVLVASGLLYHRNYQNALRADAERMLLSIEQIKLHQLQLWREERANTALSLLDGQSILAHLKTFAAEPAENEAAAALRARLGGFIARQRYQYAALAGADGRVLLHTGGRPEKMCPQVNSLISRAGISRRPELGDFYLHPGEASPHIDMVVPAVKGRGGKEVFLLLRIDPIQFLYPLLQTWSGKGQTGEILLVGRDGNELVFLNDLRHVENAAMRLRRPLSSESLPAAMGLRGKTGIVEGLDYRGVPVLAAVGPVPGANWALVTKMDRDEVLKGSGPLAVLLSLLVLALLAAAGAAAYLLLLRQAAAYERVKSNYDLLSEKANDGILVVDAETGTVLEANPRACEMYGYLPERMKGLKAEAVIPPGDLEVFKKRIAETRRAGSRVYEVNHLRADGTLFPAEISSSIVDVAGKATMFVIVRDIGERRRAEEKLRSSNERFTLAARAAGLGVWDWNVETNSLSWDDRMFELYGVKRENFRGAYEAWLKGLHPEDRARCERESELALKGEKVYDTEFRVLLPDGTVRHLKAIADVFRGPDGRPLRMVGVNLDITDSRLAAQRLQESEERLRVALDETGIGVWEWNVEKDLWRASPTYYTMLGYQPETGPADRKVWLERLHPEDRDGVAAKIRGVLDGSGEKYQYEARIRHADGSYRWHLVLGTEVKRGADGKPARLIGVRIDVTERRRNEEINAARLRLLQYAAAHTLDELLEETLNEAEKLTESRIGFYHFVNEDQQTLTLQNWSSATKAKFCKAEGKGSHYDIRKAGVWVECFHKREPVIHNDYASLPGKMGMPEGHATVVRELVVPVLRGEKVLAMLGVGNKPADYNQEDVAAVSLLADLAWEIAERKLAEQSLRRSEKDLKDAQRLARLGNWTLDLTSNKLEWSEEIFRIFEIDPSQFGASYEAFLGLIHPADRESVNKAYTESLKTKKPYDIVHRLLMKDGGVKYVSEFCETFYDAEGKPVRSVGTVQDVTELKRAQELLTRLTDQVPGVVYQYRLYPDGRSCFPYASSGMEMIYEVTSEEVREDASPVFGRIHPDDLKTTSEAIFESARDLSVFHWEFRVVLPRQGARWRLCDARPERLPDGGTLWHGIITDITDRKLAEEALKSLSQQRELALSAARLGWWTYDPVSKIATYDARYREIFEVTGSSQPNEEILKRLHPEDLPGVWAKVEAALNPADPRPYSVEYRIVIPDGPVKWVEAHGLAIFEGEGEARRAVNFVGTVADITERRNAEETLRKSETAVRAKLQALLSPEGDLETLELGDILDVAELQAIMDEFYALTKIGIGIIDMKGRVLVGTGWQEICTRFHRVNAETARNCVESDTLLSDGVERGKCKSYLCKNNLRDIATPIIVAGKHLGNLFLGQFLYTDEPYAPEVFRQQARRYGFDEQAYMAAYEKLPRFSREQVDTVMRFYARFSELISTLSYGKIKLARALAQSRQAELEKEHLNKALAAKNKEMENFLYITTHDLRSPLVNIQGFSQNLQRYLGEIGEALEEAGLPQERKEQAQKLTGEKVPEALGFVLESSAKMDALLSALLKVSRLGRQELNPETLDMGPMMRRIVDTMLFQVRAAGAEINIGPLPACRADAASVSQLFSNLLDNAVKYRDAGRKLVVKVSGESLGGKAVYRVEDNGPGIPAADLERLWDVFYKPARPGQKNGEGIGLPMCRRIAERNGGGIRFEANSGGGSVFVVELPGA